MRRMTAMMTLMPMVLVVGVGLSACVGGSTVGATPKEGVVDGATATSNARAPGDIDAAHDFAKRFGDDYGDLAGYGGVVLDEASVSVSVYWVGEVPTAVAEAVSDHADSFDVELVAADYSKADLLAARKVLTENDELVPGTVLVEVASNSDGSGLRVTFEGDASLADEVASAATDLLGGIPVTAEAGVGPS